VCTVFATYSPSTISPHLPPSHQFQPPQTGPVLPSCSPILQKKEKRSNIFVYLRQLHREYPCGTSIYMCITARFGSSPPFFFFLS
jgi:hypothetical protein